MTTRREFLRSAAMASAGLAFSGMASKATAAINQTAQSYNRIVGASNKVNIAFVGIGNRGLEVLKEFDKTGLANIVALCDVDLGAPHTSQAVSLHPKAKTFKDFRVMFDKAGSDFDAVVVCTPDHSHFPICMLSIKSGKHVYVEKPLTRTFYESQLLIDASLKYPHVVTQMGNQGHSEGNYFQFKAWKDAGIIKDVTKITAHMNNPRRWHGWDTKITKFPDKEPLPGTLDWDTWLSAVPYHDYNKDFHLGQWRCWYDFGMGALGDWGAHLIDTAHEFLDLGLPEEINPIRLSGYNQYFFPMSSTIEFKFPKRKKMPPVSVTWYDGVDNIPQVPAGYGAIELDPNIPTVAGGAIQPAKLNPGKEIYSKNLTFKGGSHGSTLSIIPEDKAKAMEKNLPEVPKSPSNHYANFLLGCLGKERTRSPFHISGPLSQVFCLGVIAQQTNTNLKFDRKTKQITNAPFANALLAGVAPRKEWQEFYKI